jgi:hypothetical protein
VQFNASATISGNGVLRLEGGGNDAALTTNATTLTNALGHTIDGAGQITATLVNDGVVSAIDTSFGNRLELVTGTKTNNSNMQAGPGAELFISGITINQAPGATIAANAGGTVIFNGSNTINGGRLVGPGDFVKPSSGISRSLMCRSSRTSMSQSAGILYNFGALNCTSTIISQRFEFHGQRVHSVQREHDGLGRGLVLPRWKRERQPGQHQRDDADARSRTSPSRARAMSPRRSSTTG